MCDTWHSVLREKSQPNIRLTVTLAHAKYFIVIKKYFIAIKNPRLHYHNDSISVHTALYTDFISSIEDHSIRMWSCINMKYNGRWRHILLFFWTEYSGKQELSWHGFRLHWRTFSSQIILLIKTSFCSDRDLHTLSWTSWINNFQMNGDYINHFNMKGIMI